MIVELEAEILTPFMTSFFAIFCCSSGTVALLTNTSMLLTELLSGTYCNALKRFYSCQMIIQLTFIKDGISFYNRIQFRNSFCQEKKIQRVQFFGVVLSFGSCKTLKLTSNWLVSSWYSLIWPIKLNHSCFIRMHQDIYPFFKRNSHYYRKTFNNVRPLIMSAPLIFGKK